MVCQSTGCAFGIEYEFFPRRPLRSPIEEGVVFLGHFRRERVRVRVVSEVGGVARFAAGLNKT